MKSYNIKNNAEMVEWSITAVLKTVEMRVSGGSNPSLCANESTQRGAFFVGAERDLEDSPSYRGFARASENEELNLYALLSNE